MIIMRNENRLINDFKKQTMTTIWKHLDAMAANYAVYSVHLNGLSPFLTNYDIYLYCHGTNVVVVCLDCCGHNEEQTYEESESLSSFIFAEGCEPRVSVVWKIAKAVRHIKNCFRETNSSINVHGLLLTEADILNAFELYRLWDEHHVTVIDGLQRLKYRRIRVNNFENDDLTCKDYIKAIIDASTDTSMSEMPTDKATRPIHEKGTCQYEYDDEFIKLLNQFASEGMEVVDGNPASANASDDLREEDDDDETDLEEFHEENDDNEDDGNADDLFPYGVIDQNQNVSVKVEILRPIPNPREELNKLVGCTEIKRRMDELVALTCFNKMMREQFPNNKQIEVSLHSVFLGSPGTGKTTVCKIFGSLLHQAGALSKGHVVVCDRGTFIGTLWGDEERSIRQVLEMAKGGVLMIDEAYLLNGKHEHDPGKLVIQLLMNILADETQRDIAIVLCGYKNQMLKLLNTNPGLQSRFPNKFEFADFTVEELLEITKQRVMNYDYRFTVPAWEKYSNMLAQAYQMRDPETWGNARFVANQLERIYIQHATRCVKHRPKDKCDLLKLTPEDILPIEISHPKAKIGF